MLEKKLEQKPREEELYKMLPEKKPKFCEVKTKSDKISLN